MPLNIQGDVQPRNVDAVVEEVRTPNAVTPPPLPPDSIAERPAPLPPGTVTPLPRVVEVGDKLARFVLWIAAGSIAGLLLYLGFMDLTIGSDVSSAYTQVLRPSRIGSEYYTLDHFDRFLDDLSSARQDPNWRMPPEPLQNAQGVLAMLEKLPSFTGAQKDQLKNCIPPPVLDGVSDEAQTISRIQTLDRCTGVIDGIRRAALEATGAAIGAQAASEFAAKMNDHRQSMHTFWMQASQLILLNLLLPLLTALFGYIFGTQQAQRTSSG
jgi:hypothetical protein